MIAEHECDLSVTWIVGHTVFLQCYCTLKAQPIKFPKKIIIIINSVYEKIIIINAVDEYNNQKIN